MIADELIDTLPPRQLRQALRAAQAEMAAYGSATHGLVNTIATVAPENLASQRVLIRSGMRLSSQRQNEDGSLTNVYHWRAPSAA